MDVDERAVDEPLGIVALRSRHEVFEAKEVRTRRCSGRKREVKL